MLEEKTQLPVLGVVPYLRVDIEDEDSLAPRLQSKSAVKPLDAAVLRLPHISNFTDFNPFESMEGVSINETTGELTVDSKAVLGVISIKATDSQNTEISVQKDVKLQYTDLRMAKEDLSEFKIDTSVPVTENLNLITKGTLEVQFLGVAVMKT